MTSCQCEHIAHFREETRRTCLTPNGNASHLYGVKFAETWITQVKTPMGTFTVCRDCAKDCLAGYPEV